MVSLKKRGAGVHDAWKEKTDSWPGLFYVRAVEAVRRLLSPLSGGEGVEERLLAALRREGLDGGPAGVLQITGGHRGWLGLPKLYVREKRVNLVVRSLHRGWKRRSFFFCDPTSTSWCLVF